MMGSSGWKDTQLRPGGGDGVRGEAARKTVPTSTLQALSLPLQAAPSPSRHPSRPLKPKPAPPLAAPSPGRHAPDVVAVALERLHAGLGLVVPHLWGESKGKGEGRVGPKG